jgi:hypothetical protein
MTVGVEEFIRLIGAVIHDCGVLEMLTNDAIKSLAKDPLRSGFKQPFARRIEILRELLYERTKFPRQDVTLLCKELSEIPKHRNDVAHNPIASDDQTGSYILVVRYEFDPPKIEKLTEAWLRSLLKRLREVAEKFTELMPEDIQL